MAVWSSDLKRVSKDSRPPKTVCRSDLNGADAWNKGRRNCKNRNSRRCDMATIGIWELGIALERSQNSCGLNMAEHFTAVISAALILVGFSVGQEAEEEKLQKKEKDFFLVTDIAVVVVEQLGLKSSTEATCVSPLLDHKASKRIRSSEVSFWCHSRTVEYPESGSVFFFS